jgi:ADP-heptose:LPS heptosyltransferase
VADLFVGNDAGPTHVAAAVGCPTLAIFGPSSPAVSQPYYPKGKVVTLWRDPAAGPFSWQNGVSAAEAIAAADELLAARR